MGEGNPADLKLSFDIDKCNAGTSDAVRKCCELSELESLPAVTVQFSQPLCVQMKT